MQIIISLLIGFTFVLGNVDDLMNNFESDYKKESSKKTMSKSFNNNMVMHKQSSMEHMEMKKKMKSMDMKSMDMKSMDMKSMDMKSMDMPSIDTAIMGQRSNNNKEDILTAINMEIEEYVDGLIPLVGVIGLFIFLAFMMYVIISSISTSGLKHKVKVLENLISSRLKELEEREHKGYDSILNDMKKYNTRISSLEVISNTIIKQNQQINPSKQPPIKKEVKNKNITKNIVKKDDFFLDDDFALDDNDEEVSLNNLKTNKKTNKASIADLSNLDMDIAPPSRKTKKTDTASMETFSDKEFDE